ncbi:hypothetical protein BD626DRAFT_91707 [Schizophyllum amplum]|uniref:Stress-response A/B barrel domain-containing protein n=1 Tax=Schizophyllum amplum TaxID=97359 RepID=A0A550BWI2_9AGAR|nr:hypothetical protein BD626DRAFT_412802 [Auriculariopsis ampla]TRM61194.1 hypothetical protein BD626DRAFT_91707 [Auriculariopsis ampla]
MTVLHVFKFTLRGDTPQSEADRVCSGFLEMQAKCKKANGRPYILSMKGGRQYPEAGSKTPSLQYVFVCEFQTEQDLSFFMKEDPVHRAYAGLLKPHAVDIQGMDFGVGKF